MEEIYFGNTRKGDYQRTNFDRFLKDINFSFNIPSVHIAGTNGKGSVAHFLTSVLKNEGYKVGTFSSPFFYEINEMITINFSEIEDGEIKEIYDKYKDKINEHNLSNFEIETFIAFKYFEMKKCDACIIECGMGGALDATNIFAPILSIITSVSLEHTNYLGKTYAAIANSKGGIIKQYVPAVIGFLNDESSDVIKDICVSKKSKLHEMTDPCNMTIDSNSATFSYSNFTNVKINSPTTFMIKNACIALEAVNVLREHFILHDDTIISSFLVDNLPGRYTILGEKKNIIIDGAHNPHATNALKENIAFYALNRPIHILFASFRDKNLMTMMAHLGETTKDITFTTFPNPRARVEDEYFLYLADYKFVEDPLTAFNDLVITYPDDVILITGSLAFAGYMLKRIKALL